MKSAAMVYVYIVNELLIGNGSEFLDQINFGDSNMKNIGSIPVSTLK